MTYSVEIYGTSTALPDYTAATTSFSDLGLNPNTGDGTYNCVKWTSGTPPADGAAGEWKAYVSGSKDHDWQAEQGLVKAATIASFVALRPLGSFKAIHGGSQLAAKLIGTGREETIVFG
jgi:hypothetical protein